MDTKALADLIIKEIKKFSIIDLSIFFDDELKEAVSEYNRIFEQAHAKAFTLAVPAQTRFRFIKRVIGKLIRPYTRQQMEFNYRIVELVKAQQNIIIKYQEILKALFWADYELNKKMERTSQIKGNT